MQRVKRVVCVRGNLGCFRPSSFQLFRHVGDFRASAVLAQHPQRRLRGFLFLSLVQCRPRHARVGALANALQRVHDHKEQKTKCRKRRYEIVRIFTCVAWSAPLAVTCAPSPLSQAVVAFRAPGTLGAFVAGTAIDLPRQRVEVACVVRAPLNNALRKVHGPIIFNVADSPRWRCVVRCVEPNPRLDRDLAVFAIAVLERAHAAFRGVFNVTEHPVLAH